MAIQTSVPHELAVNGASSREGESVPALLRRLMDELATLFRQEIALATAELSGALTRLLLGMGSLAGGVAVLYAGFLALVALPSSACRSGWSHGLRRSWWALLYSSSGL